MVDPVAVEAHRARGTRYAVTGTTVAIAMLFGWQAWVQWQERTEDCDEQRLTRQIVHDDDLAFIDDIEQALLELGVDAQDARALSENLTTRAERRHDDLPPPSACT